MGHEEQRYGKSKEELHGFPLRQAEVSALVERRQRQNNVNTKRSVEHKAANRVPPHGQKPLPPTVRCRQRYQTQGMIGKMGRHVAEEYYP
jgi:hypothetical protein